MNTFKNLSENMTVIMTGLIICASLILLFTANSMSAFSGYPIPSKSPSIGFQEELEQELFSLVNTHRTSNGITPLNHNETLKELAQEKVFHMLENNYATHDNDDLGFKNSTEFAWMMGYDFQPGVAENLLDIPYDDISAKEIFTAFKKSSSHNMAMLNTEYKSMAIAIRYSTDRGSGFRSKEGYEVVMHFIES